MRGYATLARIDPSGVRVTRSRGVPVPSTAVPVDAVPEPHAVVDAQERPHQLAELAGTIREQWAMTTFYLFHPESWR